MKRIVVLTFITMLLGQSAMPQSASPVLQTIKQLRPYTFPDNTDRPIPDGGVSRKLLNLQTLFKHQVRDVILDFINADPAVAGSTPSQMRTAIRGRLKAMGVITRAKGRLSFRSFGHVLDVRVKSVPGHPDLLALGIVVDLSWVEEESLYILKRQLSGWINMLSAEVNDYPHVELAQSSWLDYVLSPSAADGSWYLVTVSVKPFMASTWQYVTYRVLAPGPDGDHPRVLVHRRKGILLRGIEDEAHPCELKVTPDRLKITIPVDDSGMGSLKYYRDEYQIASGKATRLRAGCYLFDEGSRRAKCDGMAKE